MGKQQKKKQQKKKKQQQYEKTHPKPQKEGDAGGADGGDPDVFSGAIGIDLGTTYSCVAVLQHEKVEIIANDNGARTTPSYVAFTEEGRIVGDSAKSQAVMNPKNTVFDAKRLIGRRFDDPAVQKDMVNWPFKVVDSNDKPIISVEHEGQEKLLPPEEVSSMILSYMKSTAEAYLGKRVDNAVVTVPAYFNDAQRHATKDAATIAGLNVLRIINEPTAAAVAYGLNDEGEDKEKHVLIFDLGGGTFDVSLLKIDAGVFTVLATAGDTHLGGEDFDDRLVTFVRGQFEKKNKCDISESARALRRLRGACESAKRTLSSMTKAVIEVESLFEGQDLSVTVSRAKFEELCADLFQNTLKPVAKVLKDAGIEKSLVDDIVLVGGSTRVPKIQSLLEEFFEGKKLNKTINPDEAVAYGAAVQASILSGNRNDSTEDMLLLDVVPLSLGIEMQGGIMSTVVPRNTPIPCMKTSMFTTTENNQTEVEFPVYEGERMLTKDNNLLGAFTLSGIPPLPKGEAELEVQFFLDANGILTVTATDKQTGKKNNITIANDNGRLSSDDIERMVQDAKRYKLEDERRKESLSAREEFESYTNQVQETLATGVVADKLGDHHMEEIDEMLGDAVEWLDSNTTATKQEILDEKKALERRISTIFAKLVASS